MLLCMCRIVVVATPSLRSGHDRAQLAPPPPPLTTARATFGVVCAPPLGFSHSARAIYSLGLARIIIVVAQYYTPTPRRGSASWLGALRCEYKIYICSILSGVSSSSRIVIIFF
uniref:Secreted protein n=1 Tax=Trichogramma kaykai TaxID=54128 RepID=A0ABD2WXP7_9HYME